MRCWMSRPGLQSPVRPTSFELRSLKADITVQKLTQAQPIGFRPHLPHPMRPTMVQRLLAYLRPKLGRRMGCKCPFHITHYQSYIHLPQLSQNSSSTDLPSIPQPIHNPSLDPSVPRNDFKKIRSSNSCTGRPIQY